MTCKRLTKALEHGETKRQSEKFDLYYSYGKFRVKNKDVSTPKTSRQVFRPEKEAGKNIYGIGRVPVDPSEVQWL